MENKDLKNGASAGKQSSEREHDSTTTNGGAEKDDKADAQRGVSGNAEKNPDTERSAQVVVSKSGRVVSGQSPERVNNADNSNNAHGMELSEVSSSLISDIELTDSDEDDPNT